MKHIYIQQKSIHSSHVHKMLSVQTTVQSVTRVDSLTITFVANRVQNALGTRPAVAFYKPDLELVSFKLKICMNNMNCWFLTARDSTCGKHQCSIHRCPSICSPVGGGGGRVSLVPELLQRGRVSLVPYSLLVGGYLWSHVASGEEGTHVASGGSG